MISIRRVSLGGGYHYLLRSVAAGDGAGEGNSTLARYYATSGTPPGVFMGAGLAHLDGERGVTPGTQVTEQHLERMFVACADPVSGEPVGGMPRAPRGGVPVAGFDLTCSPAKSVSVAWALADEATKAVIYGCHRRAVEVVLAYAEAEVFRSRSGTNGVIEEDVDGVVAVSFSHWASRADDPQLHKDLLTWARPSAPPTAAGARSTPRPVQGGDHPLGALRRGAGRPVDGRPRLRLGGAGAAPLGPGPVRGSGRARGPDGRVLPAGRPGRRLRR